MTSRERRVAELRRQVAAGTYHVDPSRIAEAILDPPTPDDVSEARARSFNGESHSDIALALELHQTTVSRFVAEHHRPFRATHRYVA